MLCSSVYRLDETNMVSGNEVEERGAIKHTGARQEEGSSEFVQFVCTSQIIN